MQSFHSKFLTLGVVAASAVMLTACGGGSGGEGNTNSPLTAQMGSQTCYVGEACQITIKGGERPYSLFSSEQKVTPNATIDKPGVYTFYPNSVPAGTGSSSSTSSQDSGTLNLVVTTKKSTWAAGANFKIDLSVNILKPDYYDSFSLIPAPGGECTTSSSSESSDISSGCLVAGYSAKASVVFGTDATTNGKVKNLKFSYEGGSWALCTSVDCSNTTTDPIGPVDYDTQQGSVSPYIFIKADASSGGSMGLLGVDFTDSTGASHHADFTINIQSPSASTSQFSLAEIPAAGWGTSSAKVDCSDTTKFGFGFTGAGVVAPTTSQTYSFSARTADGQSMDWNPAGSSVTGIAGSLASEMFANPANVSGQNIYVLVSYIDDNGTPQSWSGTVYCK